MNTRHPDHLSRVRVYSGDVEEGRRIYLALANGTRNGRTRLACVHVDDTSVTVVAARLLNIYDRQALEAAARPRRLRVAWIPDAGRVRWLYEAPGPVEDPIVLRMVAEFYQRLADEQRVKVDAMRAKRERIEHSLNVQQSLQNLPKAVYPEYRVRAVHSTR